MIFTEIRDRKQCMFRCVEIMAYTGGCRDKVKLEATFFCWLHEQILLIEDYAYPGTEFRGDPDLPLPLGSQWGYIGKKKNPKMLIMFLYFYILCF